ncbi:hypothetical protein CJ469_04474 [Nocardia farcinica]|nr:hypothetical protein CJ469_04474 [Nocardia farcinica]PFX07837.1 hypothetical protein CJ468_03229 [Nocardia farcinica]
MHVTMLAHCHSAIDRFRPCHPRRLACAGEKWGADPCPSPVDRRNTGPKHHVLTCGNVSPLAIALPAANANDRPGAARTARQGQTSARSTRSTVPPDHHTDRGQGLRLPASTTNCGDEASPATSRAAAPTTKPRSGGSSNNPLHCYTNTASPSGENTDPTPTTDSSTSQPPSTAGDDSAIESDRSSQGRDAGASSAFREFRRRSALTIRRPPQPSLRRLLVWHCFIGSRCNTGIPQLDCGRFVSSVLDRSLL